jgi:hypothetical protein
LLHELFIFRVTNSTSHFHHRCFIHLIGINHGLTCTLTLESCSCFSAHLRPPAQFVRSILSSSVQYLA